MSLLDVKDLKTYFYTDSGVAKAVDGVTFSVDKGKVLGIVGESGCGKSTIAGIHAAKSSGYTGRITLGGVPRSEVAETDLMKHVVLVRHNSYLFKGTVEENLRMAEPDATKEEMEAVLQKVNLLGFLQTQNGLQPGLLEKAGNLSGGQCQRVAIARAIVGNPDIILADEPTGNLDSKMGIEVMDLLHQLNKEDGRTIVMVTHNEAQAKQTSRTVRFFDGRQVQ